MIAILQHNTLDVTFVHDREVRGVPVDQFERSVVVEPDLRMNPAEQQIVDGDVRSMAASQRDRQVPGRQHDMALGKDGGLENETCHRINREWGNRTLAHGDRWNGIPAEAAMPGHEDKQTAATGRIGTKRKTGGGNLLTQWAATGRGQRRRATIRHHIRPLHQENSMPRRSSNSPPAKKPPVSGSISTMVQQQPDVGETEALLSQESCVAVLEPTRPDNSFDDMFAELEKLSEALRTEFRTSIAELQAAQSAAAETQSDVLRTLTQAVFQSVASRDVSPESLDRAIAGAEARLIARIGPAAGSVTLAEIPKPAISAAANSRPIEAHPAKAPPKPVAGLARSWAEIRSEMMSGGELAEAPVAVIPEPDRDLPEVTQLSSDRHFRLPAQDPSLEVPATVDLDAISDSQLRDAFREREEFITTLIARIRRQQETATQQLSAEQLRQLVSDLPEELAAQVRHTLKQMNDLARMGELELSLERARIARQVNQLEHSRQTIEHNARQIGLHLNPDGTIAPSASQPGRGTSSRRWLGKLGFGQ